MMHLGDGSTRRLLDGSMDPAEARALAAHLETECPECEAVLASGAERAIDGAVDAALMRLAAVQPEEAGNDLEYARIERAMRRRPAVRVGWAVAAAAAVVAVIGVQLARDHRREAPWDGMKGTAPALVRAVPLRLSTVAVLADAGHERHLVKVASGETVSSSGSLQFQIDLGEAADVVLLRAGPDGHVDVFWHQRVAGPGRVPVTIAGAPAAYPLARLSGNQRFLALASPDPLTPRRIDEVTRALGPNARPGAEAAPVDGVSVEVLEITVR